ncbi:hypothetical protein, partial [Paenibacillus naphthalenovorans]|uniref:hypothetical protein n=1 Tax=Paenibacillus naphthalenovorans TaxID=162209 RepID=UPI003D2A32AB
MIKIGLMVYHDGRHLFCLIVIARTFTLPNEAVFFYFASHVSDCLVALWLQGFRLVFALRKLS